MGVAGKEEHKTEFLKILTKKLKDRGFEVISSKKGVDGFDLIGCDVFILLLFKEGKSIFIEKRGGISERLAYAIKYKAEFLGIKGLKITASRKQNPDLIPIIRSSMPSLALPIVNKEGCDERMGEAIHDGLCELSGAIDGSSDNIVFAPHYCETVVDMIEDGIISCYWEWEEMLQGRKEVDLDKLRQVLKGYHLKLKK